MPLERGSSEAVRGRNIAELIKSGYPAKQAEAIAYSEARKSGKDGLTAREYDSNGWAEIKGNPVSKVGVFPYIGRTIDPSLDPEKTYMVYRPAEELSKTDCIESFKLIPWIDLHPRSLLGSENFGRVPAEEKGIHGVIGEDVYFDDADGILRANIKIFTEHLEDRINIEGIRELSAGYGCIYEICSGVFNGQPYDVIQRNIRGNHLASVPEGRMGPDVAVLDHQLTFTMDAKDIEMTEEEKKMKECADRAAADGFKRYSKDADEEKERKEKEEKEAADRMARDKAGKDADTEKENEERKKKEAEDKAAKDKMARDAEEEEEEKKRKEAEDKKGMDAKITTLSSELDALKKGGIKAMFGEIKKRDSLYSRLSPFVGAFDHYEMTSSDVAQYGVKKLGLNCTPGAEMAALDGYLHNRPSPSDEVGYAFDAGVTTGGEGVLSEITAFLNKAA